MFQLGWKIEDGENPLFNFPLGFKDKTLACRSDLETVKASTYIPTGQCHEINSMFI